MSSVPSAPPSYESSKSLHAVQTPAGQSMQMQPLIEQPPASYPVQAGGHYPAPSSVNYSQPSMQPVILGQPVMQQNVGWYPASNPVYPQQSQTIIVGGPTVNYIPHIVTACFVTWCCCFCFGLVAFVLAMFAQNYAGRQLQQQTSARAFAGASIGFSIAGIVTGVIIVIVVVVMAMQAPDIDCRYTVRGKCYAFRLSSDYSSCQSTYYDGYCYF